MKDDLGDVEAMVRHALENGWTTAQTRAATDLTMRELLDVMEALDTEADHDE